jgi:hypothetical protein
MADPPSLTPFQASDRFLRRVGLPDHMKRRIVHWRAFKEKDPTLSFTFQDESLRGEASLDRYQNHFSEHLGGNLPGVVWLSFEGLTSRVNPPLVPRQDPNIDSDPVYGHLHCVTDAPRDKEQMQLLAKLVNDDDKFGGILREFVKLDAA